MKEHPILFKGEMVRAILAGSKTQTRRVVKPQPISEHVGMVNGDYAGRPNEWFVNGAVSEYTCHGASAPTWTCPYGVPGDRLWVRETLCMHSNFGFPLAKSSMFTASGERVWSYAADEYGDETRRKPSIFMPRWASRITLEITGVRVERLQDISENDAIAEGVERLSDDDGYRAYHRLGTIMKATDAVTSYRSLWDSLNAKRAPWASNPWVWCVEFKRIAQ